MAIYDCFQYFNEDHILDLRFNILNSKVDYFVISESTKTHQGSKKKLNFNINNFPKFKKKIIYLIADYKDEIFNGLKNANDEDLVIISDSDEIPDLDKLSQINSKTKFTAFSQKMFMYKLNLQNIDESNWMGSRLVLKKNLVTPQKIRNIKFKNYPFWRFDKKNLQIINGGWHFSFLHNPSDIAKKVKAYSHGEFNKEEFIDENKIAEKISKNVDIFDRKFNLKKINIDESYPKFIRENVKYLDKWIL